MKTIVLYHKDCSDGTTAAAIVAKKYPDALLFAVSHGATPEELAEIAAQASTGDRILTVDCVIGVRAFLAAGHKVTSIDHHISVNDEFKALAKENAAFTYVFDNSKCGSSLTWSYLFPDEHLPELVKYVEDFDLWNWKHGDNTKYIASYLYPLSNKPEEVRKLLDGPLDVALENGRIISAYSDFMLAHAIKGTEPIDLLIGGYTVPFYNITSYKSEGGNILSTERDRAVALFTIDAHRVKISLRSLDSHTPSALDIATLLGGGGHRNSSGAAMTLETFFKAIKKP
ncbi:MAG TPA: phosphoesterase [Candidatus Paceibacterota bacterium]|nr:phosphoesterase [Candidatus Paceibacterota bacterium]